MKVDIFARTKNKTCGMAFITARNDNVMELCKKYSQMEINGKKLRISHELFYSLNKFFDN